MTLTALLPALPQFGWVQAIVVLLVRVVAVQADPMLTVAVVAKSAPFRLVPVMLLTMVVIPVQVVPLRVSGSCPLVLAVGLATDVMAGAGT